MRFGDAFHKQLQHFVDSVRGGQISGPNVPDGYMATAVFEPCVRSLETDEWTEVAFVELPALYGRG